MPGQRSFLLLHGYANHRPPEHWQHWLCGQLEAAGQRVIYPQLPDPDRPTLPAWLEALDANLDALSRSGDGGGDGGGERIVLCHSLACLLWLHAAAMVPAALAPDRLVLVSPPAAAQLPAPAVGFALDPEQLDAGAVKASAREEVRIVGSDADPYNPDGAAAMYARPLGVPVDLVVGGGHISADDGYGPWPAMLAWCLDPGGPVGETAGR